MINDDRSINVAGLLVLIMRLTLTLSENYTYTRGSDIYSTG